VWPKGFQEV